MIGWPRPKILYNRPGFESAMSLFGSVVLGRLFYFQSFSAHITSAWLGCGGSELRYLAQAGKSLTFGADRL